MKTLWFRSPLLMLALALAVLPFVASPALAATIDPESRAALDSALTSIGHGPADVRQVLVTHIHRDHYTQALQLRAAHGTRVSLGAGEKDSIELILSPDTGPLHPQVAQLAASGAGPVRS